MSFLCSETQIRSLERYYDRLKRRSIADFRDIAERYQGVRLGVVGGCTAARDVVGNHPEVPNRSTLALEVAGQINQLLILEPSLGNVIAIHENHSTASFNSTVPVIQIDEGLMVKNGYEF